MVEQIYTIQNVAINYNDDNSAYHATVIDNCDKKCIDYRGDLCLSYFYDSLPEVFHAIGMYFAEERGKTHKKLFSLAKECYCENSPILVKIDNSYVDSGRIEIVKICGKPVILIRDEADEDIPF